MTPRIESRKTRRMARATVAAAAVAALITGTAGTASAATDTGTVGVNVIVDSGIVLSGLSDLTMQGAPGAVVATADNYTVTTNNPTGYTVTVSGVGDFAGATPGNTDIIPLGSLETNGVSVTNAPQFIHGSNSATAESGDVFGVSYQLTIPFVTPDTYSTTLEYVATTNL